MRHFGWFSNNLHTWKYMAHCNLVLTCCQCRYSSTFACASGSLGYQWSSTGNVLERYFIMAMVSFNGVPLCVAKGTYKTKWHYWILNRKWIKNLLTRIDFGHFFTQVISIFNHDWLELMRYFSCSAEYH